MDVERRLQCPKQARPRGSRKRRIPKASTAGTAPAAATRKLSGRSGAARLPERTRIAALTEISGKCIAAWPSRRTNLASRGAVKPPVRGTWRLTEMTYFRDLIAPATRVAEATISSWSTIGINHPAIAGVSPQPLRLIAGCVGYRCAGPHILDRSPG
jgi:hypothetical protein